MKSLTKGITLLELVITLSILTCVLSFILYINPFYSKKNEGKVIKDNLISAIQYARTLSLSHSKGVYFRPLEDENWAKGMGLYTAKDNIMVYQWRWNYSQWIIEWKGFKSSRLTFAYNIHHSASNGTFFVKNRLSKEVIIIKINRLGHIQS